MAFVSVKAELLQEDKSIVSRTYPWIGTLVDSNLIVLFTSTKTGIVLEKGKTGFYLGEKLNCWDEVRFVPYYNEIKIQMKE